MLTTHYMDEAEQLCDRLVIMDDGQIVAAGSPRELIDQHSAREVVELRFRTDEEREKALPHVAAIGERYEALADRILVYTSNGEADADRLTNDGVQPDSVLVRRSSSRTSS